MDYLGDFPVGGVVHLKRTSRQFSTGAPFTLAGTPAVRVYKDDGTTEDDSGITLTVDFDGKTGVNHIKIDTSADGTFYSAGGEFQIVISAGTVDGISVVGEVLGHFSLERAGGVLALAKGSNGLSAIKGDTSEIGAAGAGLTALPWNPAWGAEVQSEVTDALNAYDAPTAAELTAEINDVQSDIAALDTLIDGVKAKTDQLTFGVANVLDANMVRINDNANSAANIERSTLGIVLGVADSGASSTSIPTSSLVPAAVAADQFKGRIVTFDKDTATTSLRGQSTDITANTSGGTLTVTALTTAPQAGDTFVIT